MKMNKIAILSSFLVLFTLSACETIPYEERVANFETKMRTDFVGKSIDSVILAFGPPQSTYTLSDGRKMAQYLTERDYTTGGGTYTDYETEVIGYRDFVRDNGTHKKIPITRQYPVQRIEPLVSHHEKCAKRFVVNKANIVEDFKWEGNKCF